MMTSAASSVPRDAFRYRMAFFCMAMASAVLTFPILSAVSNGGFSPLLFPRVLVFSCVTSFLIFWPLLLPASYSLATVAALASWYVIADPCAVEVIRSCVLPGAADLFLAACIWFLAWAAQLLRLRDARMLGRMWLAVLLGVCSQLLPRFLNMTFPGGMSETVPPFTYWIIPPLSFALLVWQCWPRRSGPVS